MKFKDPNHKESSQEILRQGKQTEFWRLIVEAIEESKKNIQAQQDGADISTLPADQYKHQNEIFKAKKHFLDMLINTPDNIISWLQDPDNSERNFDPYIEAKDMP